MQQNGVDADRFLYSVQSASPAMKEAPEKCFFLAKKFLQNGEHEQAKRHVSAYLGVKERDPKAHRLLGLIFEKERDVNKAVGCYKRSVDLDPRQKDVVLRVAELLCNLPETDSRADFWVDKAAKLLPNHPIVFKLKEKLLSAQGQRGRNQLFDLLKSQLKVCPSDPYINVKLVQLYCSDGQLKEAVDHCLAVEKKRDMRYSLDWYSTVTQTIQEYLTQPSVLSNHSLCSMLRRELLLAHCNLLRQTLFEPGVEQSVKALQSFDQAMQSVKMASGNTANGLTELVSELRGHLYLYAGTFFLKMVHNREYQKKPGVQLASLCYLLAYQIPRPKSRPSKGEPAASRLLDLLASDRKSQSGHMLLSLAQQGECFKEIVENLCNEPGKKLLFEDLFGSQCPAPQSFIANDNIHGVSTKMPEISDLEKLDSDAVLLCGESLQQLTWLGLQLVHLGRRPCFGAWLKKLFPRHIQETFKLDSNATESICLLDLEVFLCGVVFTSPLLQAGHGVLPPCCLPLQIIGQLATERQSEWWDDACCFINRKVTMSNTARVQKTIQCGLDTLKGIGKLHGLQPALLICWAQHLSYMGHSLRSCDKRAYIGRSVHYWAVVKPLLQDIKANRSIPIPLKPLFPHVRDKDIQVSSVVGYENEAETVFAVLQDIKGNTEHAISILEDAKTISAFWHLAQIFRRCSEEAANSSEKAEYLRKIWKCLTKVCQADAADLEKVQLPISMEELMDWLSEVRQQLGEGTGALEDEAGCQEQPGTGPIFVLPEPSDPSSLSSRSLPAKSVASPSKRLVFSPKTPPQWAEDQTSMFQMLFQEMEALTNELHNWSGSMASANPRAPGEAHTVESHGESFSPAQNLHGAPLTVATTGLSGYCSQPPAYDSQYLLRTATNVTPTKAPVYRMNSLPPQPRIYPHDQLYGAPLHFDQPAPSLLSPYGEDYYSHAVSQSTTNPTLPEPGYFTKSRPQSQPLKCEEEKFPDLGFGQPSPAVPLRAGVITQSTTAAAFKFNSNFKSNDGDFTFSSAQAKNNEILRPLTSDMHIGTEGFLGEKRPNEDQTPGHSVIFSFGCKDSSGISPTSATQGPSNQSIFVEKEKPFTFTGMSKVMDRVDKANRKQRDEKGMESDNDSTRVEEDEDGPHFEPIIPLPDKVDVKTGEEEEEEIFCSRAKLFRFESDSKEWKERGIGSVKILRHKTSSKVRLLMRRDQVLKICANHYITEDMELKLNAGSDRSWVWHAVDYADEIPKPEQLAIRFKTVEEAALFKGKFDQARMSTGQDQKQMKSADVKGFVAPIPALGAFTFQFGEHFQKTSGSNSASLGFGSFPQIPTSFKFGTSTESATADNLQITKKLSPKISSEDTAATVKPVSSSSSIGFGAQFTKKPGQWDCDTCSIMNEATATSCIACQAPNPNRKSLVDSTSAVKPASSSSSSGFGAQFTKKPGQWDCDTCSIMNEATATSCIACQAPNPNRKSLVDSTSAVKPASSLSSSGFGAQFTKKPGQWDCDTCSIMNEATATSCIACQAPNPNRKSLVDSTSAVKPASSLSSSGFGAQFTKKPGQWDCDTCSIMNEATATSCIACQAPNPSRKSLVDSTSAVKPASSLSSSGFGAQFTKKPGQWDCDTCSIMNESTATSCIACQAPNPSRKSLVDSTSAVKPASSSSSSGFGPQFTKKPGQWDCDTCSIMNEATANSCIACQAPNPNRKSLVDSTSAVKPASSLSSRGFGPQFTKKPGQWDCDTCSIMNEATATSCIACQAPNPNRKSLVDSTSAVKPASSSSSSGFGAQFTKKTGQWDCDTCSIMNEATATSCIACQAPNPNRKSLVDSTSAVKPASSLSSSGFGAQFTKKPGQWDCDTCSIMNEATATSCIACQAPNPNRKSLVDSTSAVKPTSSLSSSGFGAQFTKKPGQWDCDTCSIMNESTATSCIACQAPNPSRKSLVDSTSAVKPASSLSSSGFGAQFTKKPGQWDCDTCSIMNEATATSCIACQAPNPSRKSLVDSTSAVKPASSLSSSGFGAQFTKKPGQWDCDTCSIMNETTATSCIACQAPNPSRKSLVDSTSAVKPASSSSSSGFGPQFTKKPGQWDCDTCSIMNEATANSCIACQAPNPNRKSLVDSTSAVKPASSLSSRGFGPQFTKKPGQWDCDTCSIMNEATATSCIACQAPNPNRKSLVDSTSAVKPASSSSSSGFGAQFTKKPGQWDCDTCSIMNEATATSCIACQAPNPNRKSLVDSTSAVKPASSSSSSGFGAQFTKKPGQWDCDTCSIMNEATATSCIACQAPNPNRKSLVDSTSAVKPASSLSSSGFGAQFTKMSGQWDCDTCAVRNEATAACCMACQAPNPCKKSSQWDCDTCAVRNEATAACCMDCQAPNPCKKSSQWDCDTCAVRNEATAACCMACQTPNPCKKSSQWDCDSCAVRNEASATRCISCQAPFKIQMLEGPWDCEKCLTRNEFSSSHCVSCGTPNSSAKVKATPLLSGFILNPKSPEQFPRFSAPSTFKFGQADDKGPHSSKVELKSATSSSSSGFSFSMPIPTGGFKFGIQEPVKEPTFESFPKNHSNESKEKGNHGTDVTKSYFPAQGEQGESPVLHFKPYTLPLADLTRSSQGDFQFEHKDPEFKDFTQAGEQVFTSLQPPVKINSSVQDEDDMYKTEENDDIQFEPVVKMPEKVDLVTGEENEDVLYSQRVKLFRFDADSSQWKERGVGNLKFLKNKENGRLRVLMRRDQVLKVCANHWINTTMNLKPLSGSDRAWMWLANDFSDGDAKPEQLAAKFKTPDLAKEFKLKFEECQKLLLDIPLQTPHKLIDSGRTAHLIQKAEEMKSGLKHLKSFLTDDKAKISQDEGQVSTATAADTSRLVLKSNADSTIPTLEWEDYNLQKEPLHDSSEASLCASPSSNSPVQRALFRFGESTSDFNFSFQPIVTPTKSPSRVNQSRVSVGTDEESETTQEDDRDGQFFEPIVPLPDLVDISTGEENEQVVFIHRAKLFRYAKDLQQWKERGIGDIKILQNDDSKRVRLVMRRDQVLKLCANHWITSSMKLEPMKGAEKAWVWSAFDFAEGKGNIEQLAVRFKLQEVANSFKDAFEKAKDAQENKVLVSPISPGEAPSQEALCQKPAAVMLKETSQENLSHGSCTPDNMTAAPFMAHSHNLSAAVVSPPKFVFGSDSVQKIFGSPSSCTQNVSSKIKPKEKALTASSPSFKISVSASQPSLSPMMPAFRVPEGGLDFRLFKDNPMAFWTSAASNRFKPQVASESKGRTDIADTSEDVEDVQVVFVREPTSEQARLARELLLPITFFCYQNEPDYISDDEDDDEDFDTAVRKLNGRLYPSNPEGATVQEKESSGKWLGDGVATCERVPVTELGRDKCLQHPHTEADKGVQRREQLSLSAVSSSSDTPVATVNMTKGVVIVPESQPDSTSDAYPVFVAGDSCPIDLSAKKSDKPDSTSKDTFSFGIQSVGGVSFADLANSSGEYAFGKQDSSFTWANAGAAVFGIGTVSQRTEDEASDDAEAPSSDDVHFEPIVHLPEVEIKSGEEDEEVLFKARAKLYRWDRALCQWKERGVGDLKILCQQQKCYYRVLMRREQVLKVCANHTITTAMELKPMSSSSNALVWTATDYSEENPKVEQLAAKFKNEELADTFKKMFELCQSHLTQVEPSQTPGHLEFTSRD
ncbi:E3 SUMO-protein ligase RanBP2 isoform X2 [Paramormyrops kingsleyae]|uniref:E3 SUMO-protein ligase RanBP2 isoform X2 n=1 Tax=Paramormyrops kingsleyae TaxID=1676925 RepID=UPI003B96BEC1